MNRQRPIYAIGHRNPDTDSICAAICYAHLKTELGFNVVPARAGSINRETAFALQYFGVEAPVLLSDVYPRVADVSMQWDLTINARQNLRELAQIMCRDGVKSIPVLDDRRELVGMVTVSDVAKRYFEEVGMQSFADIKVSLRELANVCDAFVVEGEDRLGEIVSGEVRIAAGSLQTVQDSVQKNDVILVGDRIAEIHLACIEHGAVCLLLTGNSEAHPDVLESARRNHAVVLSAPHDTYTCARLINQCVPVSSIMQTDVIRFKPADMVSEVKGLMEKHRHRFYPVVENNKLVGIVSSESVMVPEKTRLILVDHNERSQAVEGIEMAKIIEIIDHHRLGGIQTNEPIFTRQDPVGCTCTIVADMHLHRQVAIPPKIAGLMLSAILSDTVLFKSPTCTEHDREMAQYLSKIAGVDVQEYGMELLKAGSDIGNMTAGEIAKNDMKEFLIGRYRLSISQCSVLDRQQAADRKDEIVEALDAMRKKEGYDLSMVMITNVLEAASVLVFTGEPKTLIGEAFHMDASHNMMWLPGVMSRKKQVVPPLSEAVKFITA
ncbi:MAG: putative manganese-dependent inorganic diphosphatase [Bacteroides sp.]|nr:putative manganese-dependent inorganic diphosphatase [Bacteroides sp.]